MIFIKHQLQHVKSFYSEKLRKIFPITVLVFVIVIMISSIVVSLNPALATRLLVQFSGFIDATIQPVGLLPTISEHIFTGILMVICGCIPFLFVPMLLVLLNGSMIGVLFGSTAISTVTPQLIFASILPHGIFLIPAMLIGATCGIYVCKCITSHLLHKEPITSIKEIVVNIGRIYAFVILPLLILSAIVQVCITPIIVLFL